MKEMKGMKESFDFSFSFENVKGIPFEKYENNFTFIVNDKSYETSRYAADLLSPIVRGYHYTDETIDHLNIQIPTFEEPGSQSSSTEKDYFSDFLKLTDFKPKKISDIQRKHYIEYFIQLGNIEEYLRLQPEITEEATIDNIIDRLQFLAEYSYIYDIKNNFNFQRIISFASSHFSSLSKEGLKRLPIEILSEIIEDESLKIDDEDSLLNFILELYLEDDKYSILFEYVQFLNVSEETLIKFINKFNVEHINSGIWNSICRCLLPSQKVEFNQDRYIEKHKKFEHDSNNEFHGILRYLSEETHGNIHDNGTIEITSNSIHLNNNSYHPKNLVDYEKDNYYESNNEEKVFICFDFKDKLINPSSYSIKSYNDGQTSGHLRNWVVEVSNDKNTWKTIDKHENDSVLRGNNIIATFNTEETKEFYRFIRLRQTGESWYSNGGYYYIYFYFIEFYGKLKEPNNSSTK